MAVPYTKSEKTQAILDKLRGGLVVSCQAHEPDGCYGVDVMTRMAVAAELGGASGIRTDDPDHVASIRKAVKLPIIGIYKQDIEGFAPRITLNMDRVADIVNAGADIIAIEATDRPHPFNTTGFELITQTKAKYDVVVMADCSTIHEAELAYKAGADILSSTMSGYTPYSLHIPTPDFEMVAEMKKRWPDRFIICEGRVNSPEQAGRLIRHGADAVCCGSNIIRPIYVTQHYVAKMKPYPQGSPVLAVDIGGTKIACGVVAPDGTVSGVEKVPTPGDTAEHICESVITVAKKVFGMWKGDKIEKCGISTGGTINYKGDIIYATDTLAGWKGFPLKQRVEEALKLTVTVVNDGNAAALGEATYGVAKNCHSVLGITVGTGFGAGVVIDGEIYSGTLDNAINMGAIIAQVGGKKSDKVVGALEAYVSGRAVYNEYVDRTGDAKKYADGKAVGDAALAGDFDAKKAVEKVCEWLGIGIATIVACHNPEMVVIGGSVADLGEMFINTVRQEFEAHAFPALKNTPINLAEYKSNANLAGAAVYAWTH